MMKLMKVLYCSKYLLMLLLIVDLYVVQLMRSFVCVGIKIKFTAKSNQN